MYTACIFNCFPSFEGLYICLYINLEAVVFMCVSRTLGCVGRVV